VKVHELIKFLSDFNPDDAVIIEYYMSPPEDGVPVVLFPVAAESARKAYFIGMGNCAVISELERKVISVSLGSTGALV
jgi:hypothetical protein